MVNHIFAKTAVLPPLGPGLLYEYVTAANGVFVRAERNGLRAMIPVAHTKAAIRGLYEVQPYVELLEGPVPARLIATITDLATLHIANEVLFYLTPWPYWMAHIPDQVQTPVSVTPCNPYACPDALVEVHSHNVMQAYFSPQDDRDEANGFRIYAVVGNLHQEPRITVRVGVYGHFWPIPAELVFGVPFGLRNLFAAPADDTYEPELEECYANDDCLAR